MPSAFPQLRRYELTECKWGERQLHLMPAPITAQAGNKNVVRTVRSPIALRGQVFRRGLEPHAFRPQRFVALCRLPFPHLALTVTALAVLIAEPGNANFLELGCHVSSLEVQMNREALRPLAETWQRV